MYELSLTREQEEIRDTVRDFVTHEVKPVALKPSRLEQRVRELPGELVDQASRMGLRTLALSEDAGGAGADTLTCCLVAEELGAGHPGAAMTLVHTSLLSRALFDRLMTPGQRAQFLPRFLDDDRCHLAHAAMPAATGWNYHRADPAQHAPGVSAARDANGDWVLDGASAFVLNAPVAGLFIVEVSTEADGAGVVRLVVARDTPGLEVLDAAAPAKGAAPLAWYHGSGGSLVFSRCRVPAAQALAASDEVIPDRTAPPLQAINLGIGQAAYDAALDYAKLRVQGGRRIVEHQAIGTILADMAIRLEAARNMVWKAAWAADHDEASGGRGLELQAMSKVFTSEVVHEVTLRAQECFGAMGVMRDMPLHKYVEDALLFLHAGRSNHIAKFRIAEAQAEYTRQAGPV